MISVKHSLLHITFVLGFFIFSGCKDSVAPQALYELGVSYEKGLDNLEKNEQKAIYYYRKAAKRRCMPAQYCLYDAYKKSLDGAPKMDEAIYWLFQVTVLPETVDDHFEMPTIKQVDDFLNKSLGFQAAAYTTLYLLNEKEEAAYVRLLQQHAEKGDSSCQYVLAKYYQRGCRLYDNNNKLFQQEKKEGQHELAISWFLKAAKKSHAGAQYELGKYYLDGDVVLQDYDQAVMWLSLSADQGCSDAQFELATCFANGLGVDVDKTAAFELAQKAASELTNHPAQVLLGLYYATGFGTEKNAAESAKWFKKSASNGNIFGTYYLGLAYYRGEGVPCNEKEGLRLIRKAADAGLKDAKDFLKKNSMVDVSKITTPDFSDIRKKVHVGMSYRDLIKGCGRPNAVMTADDKTTLIYPFATIQVTDDRVISFAKRFPSKRISQEGYQTDQGRSLPQAQVSARINAYQKAIDRDSGKYDELETQAVELNRKIADLKAEIRRATRLSEQYYAEWREDQRYSELKKDVGFGKSRVKSENKRLARKYSDEVTALQNETYSLENELESIRSRQKVMSNSVLEKKALLQRVRRTP